MKSQNLSVKRLFGRVAIGFALSMSGITIALFLVTKQTAVLLTGGALLLCALVGIFVLTQAFGKRLSQFTADLCQTLDHMIAGNEAPQRPEDSETQLARIGHRLARLYQIMQENRRRVDEERQELQTLVSDISHQVKTPVSNLKMATDTLLEKPMTEAERTDFIRGIRSQTDKLDFLFQALVKTSRLETGVIQLDKKPGRLFDTVAQAMSGIVYAAEKKEIAVSVDCPEDLTVSHDSKWTSEALFNLLDNAVKYTPAGGKISVSVVLWEMYMEIKVADTGKGISESNQAAIFRRFYREEEVHEQQGVGIGLYLAREIVTRQGGYIKVVSEPGKGSEFSIMLPTKWNAADGHFRLPAVNFFEMSERCNISPRFSMKFFGRCNISRTFGFYNTLIKYGGDTTMTWPFENDTSAITKKLAQRSFKANKLRNIVAVIAIVLTSMLFTSVTTLCVGAIQSIQTTILQIRGTSPSTGTSVNWIAIIAALFFIMIFVITGYLLIRNIFEISVVQEIKKYGLLRTIGTTEKQIKRIVYKQAFWLSIIAISIGLILGYIVGILMLPWILNFMKGEYHNLSVNLSFNPIIFVVAGIFSAITVWVSIKKPFKIAATISPIEATRYYEKDNYHSANKNRLSFKNRITEMAWRNLRRNSKRTIFIVLSMILCIILLNSAIAIGNSVDVKKYVSSVTSFDFVVASPNTFSNVQGFRFKDDSVSNEIISDIENNIPVLNGSRIYKNTLDDVSVTYDYGSLVTEVLDEYTEDNHLIRSGMVDGRTYPVKLGVDYRPLCNIYGVEKSILPKLNFIEGETDIQQLTSYLESGNYVIEISAINPNESPEFLCPLNQEVTIYKDGLPYKTVSVIARAVVDFSLVESPGKNVGYTDVGGDRPIFYMSNEMFVELYNNPAIMSYVFDVEKEHFLPATEYINSLPTVEYASSETLAQTMNGLKQTIFIIGGLIGFLLGSIGLVNFSNIIITGIINRQREFATLESIGMTKKQINKLTVLEGLFYAFLICVMGLPLSLIVANTILPTFFNQPDLWLFTIQPTIFPLILEGIVICVVAIIVPHVSFRYFRKTSIVARLRVVE